MTVKTSEYELFNNIIKSWKSRAKKIKVSLKEIAKKSDITSQHLSKIIAKKVLNPRVKTINNIEKTLCDLERKSAIKNGDYE